MNEVSGVNVEIKTRATLTFTRDTSYIREVKQRHFGGGRQPEVKSFPL